MSAEATVTFKLNGKDVTVPKGWTVMQAAKRESVEIPHFCWHEGLSVAGVCRFCMVKVEGRPKLEISCNLPATDGMVVSTIDPTVKEAHKWALEFHLVNHPLDCPICDQAGECGLQDYYMKVGKYKSQMNRPKVLKPKALDVGGDLVLDTERCILCSRCVRFEEEVTKTGALGIFDRGDRAIIGTYPGKKIEHQYTANLVDICPVGAFTSKDFRFKQRVWFLEDKESICPGCSTGCSTKVYAKVETRKFFRIKPRHSEVNGHWICDRGRQMYRHVNKENRLLAAYSGPQGPQRLKVSTSDAMRDLANLLRGKDVARDVGLLISPQYTNEEYAAILQLFVKELGVKKVWQWRSASEDLSSFDGILLRGDHHPNTAGLKAALLSVGIDAPVKNQFDEAISASMPVTIALAPEIADGDTEAQLKRLSGLGYVSLWTSQNKAMAMPFAQLIPTKTYTEKTGHFSNYQGKNQALTQAFPAVVATALNLEEIAEDLRMALRHPTTQHSGAVHLSAQGV